MLRPALIGLLAAVITAGSAQAEPRMVYTRHTLKVDLRDLDLKGDAGQRALQIRIADAANEVCGGRPDQGSRYTPDELKRVLPAYDECRAEAIQRANASIMAPVHMAAGN